VRADVVIVGAGAIGLATARALAAGGATVRLVDRGAPGGGATQAAGGILSPTDPAEWAPPLGPYNLDAIARWPGWAEALTAETGHDSGRDVLGELRLARTDARVERDFLAAAAAGAAAGGWAHRTLDASELARLEPGLAPVHEALHVPGTAAVRVDALVAALAAACAGLGVALVRGDVTGVGGGTVRLAGGETLQAGTVILAGGAWMREPWVPEAIRPPVAPLLGEALVLAPAAPVCAHMLRTAAGSVVPRADGTVYTGTTVRERGFQRHADLGSVRAVAARAAALLPALDGARFVEARAGLRPVSADGLPFVGPAADGIVLAGGHGREGIIHAPLCADGVARGVLADDWSLVPDAFRPSGERLDG
jgi:glycine oxidase